MPQLKLPKSLPKSLPKLQTARRILRRRSAGAGSGGVGGNGISRTGGAVAGVATGAVTVAAGIAAVPHAQFINRTPQRISTISSLMHEQGTGAAGAAAAGGGGAGQLQATYCSAGSLDDDYYAPYGGGGFGGTARASRPISPIKMPPPQPASGGGAAASTLGATAANLTQRLQRGYKSLSELRLKHLFAKQTTVRRDNIEVQRYVEQYEAERRVEEQVQAQRDRQIADNYRIHISTLPISRQNTLHGEQGEEEQREQPVKLPPLRPHSLAEHSGDESGLEQAPVTTVRSKKKKKPGIAATRFAKVRQPPLPMPVEEQQQQQQQQDQTQLEQEQKPATELPMRQAMRQNLKRLRRSIKRVSSHQPQQHDSDEDAAEDEVKVRSSAARGATLRARLRRFTSSEQLQQRWRKSFKGSTAEEQSTTAGGATAAGAGAGAVLGLGMGAQLERTMAKLNEKMQQMKFFHGRSNSAPEQNKPNTVGREPNEIDDEELEATYHHSDSSEGEDSDDSGHEVRAEDAFEQDDDELEVKQHAVRRRLQASTAWSSESLEEDEQLTLQQQQQHQQRQLTSSDYPRVLIHQQHSDAYESTLIIAVASSPSPEPREETTVNNNTAAWLPNEQIIAGFKQQQQLQQLQWPAPALYKAKSIDIFECEGGAAAAFADFDEALRNAPVLRISAGTTNTNSSGDDEEEEGDDSGSHATRIRLQLTPQIGNSCESLMEQQEPLEYDEDERQEESKSKRGEWQREQLTDAERPPSVSPPPPPLPQRRPPAAPPSAAPPIYDQLPPPLPVSKPPPAMAPPALPPEVATSASTAAPAPTPVPAPAPASEPVPASAATTVPAPIPAPLPTLTRLTQRSASMTRPSKPLVKTSSLRLTYNEQVHPGDIGKVNKLITRFEGGRPRLCARRLTHSEELTTCSDAEDEPEAEQATPTNVQRIPHIVTTQPGNNNNNSNNNNNNVEQVAPSLQQEQQQQLNLDRQNSNCSRSSEYGSPLSYPMRRSATPTRHIGAGTGTGNGTGSAGTGRALAPLTVQQSRHSRRSMTRDDDNFYSFDSDEGEV